MEKAVEFTKKNLKGLDAISACDIGTGSGAIALSYIQEIDKKVELLATDLSDEAIKVAKRNNFLLRFKYPKHSQVEFMNADRLAGVNRTFDIIMSNPPYIKETSDRDEVHHQVEAHEPHMALYINDQRYDEWFESFFSQVEKSLNSNGLFIMEGSEHHLQQQKEVLSKMAFHDVEVIKDYTGRDRFLKGIKNAETIN